MGVVKSCLEKCIPTTRPNTKVLGGGGISVKAVLVKTNPFPRDSYDRVTCPLGWMDGGCKEHCYREMWDHTESHHDGVISQNISQDYSFRLQGVFGYCLSRQLDEAVRINMVEMHGQVVGNRSEGVGGRTVMLNRKEEFYQLNPF